jgi:signal transduction histidine kinase
VDDRPGALARARAWLSGRWDHALARPSLGFEEVRKRRLFAILILPGIAILLTFAAGHLVRGNRLEGLLDLVAGLWLVLSLAAFGVLDSGLIVYRFNTALLGLLFLFLAVKGGADGNKVMWAFSFPLIAFYTLGRREGLAWTGAVYLLLLGVLFAPPAALQAHPYPPEFGTRAAGAFFLVASLSYIYESVRERSQRGLERERNKLAAKSAKLAESAAALELANRALRLGEERLERAQAIARVGNLEYDVATGLVWGSPEALRLLGLDPAHPVLPLCRLRQLGPDLDALQEELAASARAGRGAALERTVRHLVDGREVVLVARAEPSLDEAGRVRKIIGVIQDVTERRRAEAERQQLEERLARSQKMEALGILAGGVAHDLNNVLSGVVGYPELLLADLPPAHELAGPLRLIRDSGQKAAAIVQDLLALARRGVAHHKVLRLNDVVAEYLSSPEQLRLQGLHPRVAFEARLDPRLLNLRGSAVHLRKAVMNLVCNAAEALPAGGRVRLATETRYVDRSAPAFPEVPEGEYVLLRVEDDGVGIAPEDLARIFEPFYTKKKMGRSGTGLGLAVVWGTVQDHRGYVQVRSAEALGTTVELYLPVSREAAEQPEGDVPLEEYLGNGQSILVIDDVAEQRELATRVLARLGYRVQAAPSGEAGIELLAGQPVDLVVLDMIMDPGLDGLETYARIVRRRPGQRAVIVSGFSETERVREAQRLGATTYVKKPYTLETLGLAVRDALRR